MFKVTVPEMIVKLPSAGKLEYSPAEVRLRAITGKEEMKMNSTTLIKYIDLVIKECAKEVKTGAPLELEKLTSEDKIYLFMMLRSLSYGDSMTAGYRCNVCGTQNTVNIELSKLPVKQLTDEMLLDSTITLPISKLTLKLRILTDAEMYELEADARALEVKTHKTFKECRDFLLRIKRIESLTYDDSEKGIVTETNTPATQSTFQILIESLIGKDLAYLDKKWGELNDYGIDLTVDHKCTGCGTIAPVGVDVTSTEFFRPSNTE